MNHLLRVACDSSNHSESAIDLISGKSLSIQQGTTVHLQVGLFRGGSLENVSSINTLRCEIKAADATSETSSLVALSIANANLNASLTTAEWNGSTNQHATFIFTNAQTSLAAGGYRIIIRGTNATEEVTYLSAGITVHDDAAGTVNTVNVANEQGLVFRGFYNATTNSPSLSDATGSNADLYIVQVEGTRNFGSGNLELSVNDRLIHNGTIWTRIVHPANQTGSLNLSSGGTVQGDTTFAGDLRSTGNDLSSADHVLNRGQLDNRYTQVTKTNNHSSLPLFTKEFAYFLNTPVGETLVHDLNLTELGVHNAYSASLQIGSYGNHNSGSITGLWIIAGHPHSTSTIITEISNVAINATVTVSKYYADRNIRVSVNNTGSSNKAVYVTFRVTYF